MNIGEGLPPIPARLVRRIQSGKFIELSELLPDQLGIAAVDEDNPKPGKPLPKHAISIIEWDQGFGIYAAVLSKSQPSRVADLLGYQALILQAYTDFGGDAWGKYDRAFRLKAPSQRDKRWSVIDTTLWSLAFSAKSRDNGQCTPRDTSTEVTVHCPPVVRRVPQVCYKWNRDPAPDCTYRNCKYEHQCSYCINNPKAADTAHKAIHCPYYSNHRFPPLPPQPGIQQPRR